MYICIYDISIDISIAIQFDSVSAGQAGHASNWGASTDELLREGATSQLGSAGLLTLWYTNRWPMKMAIEIVDMPIENGDFPYLW